ncbi:MAG: IS21 family transposase, partial [Caldimonas sp.]
MIDPELRARIRRLHFAEHWRIGTIVSELGLHHDTVERAIDVQRKGARLVRGSKLDPFRDFVAETLATHPRLRATRLFEMLRVRGYTGGLTLVRALARDARPAPRSEAFFRLRTMPGEQAQVDWGHFGKVRIGSAQRILSCFVMVLSWSRAMYARFCFDQSMESFLRGHLLGFEALGGAPRIILYDNLKSVVLDRQGDHIRFNPQILELAGHYHFAPQPCAPYRGNEKGKVERTI